MRGNNRNQNIIIIIFAVLMIFNILSCIYQDSFDNTRLLIINYNLCDADIK